MLLQGQEQVAQPTRQSAEEEGHDVLEGTIRADDADRANDPTEHEVVDPVRHTQVPEGDDMVQVDGGNPTHGQPRVLPREGIDRVRERDEQVLDGVHSDKHVGNEVENKPTGLSVACKDKVNDPEQPHEDKDDEHHVPAGGLLCAVHDELDWCVGDFKDLGGELIPHVVSIRDTTLKRLPQALHGCLHPLHRGRSCGTGCRREGG
mmetsp:Transcript_10484/g.18545  ORF Transcript_10484/g.18545 Transcript_10484/m.18545 type:complete len:205 (+) Transcript_10484:1131-1745(+)